MAEMHPPVETLYLLLAAALHRINPDVRDTVEVRINLDDEALLEGMAARGILIEGGGPDHVISARLAPREEARETLAAFVRSEPGATVIREPGVTLATGMARRRADA